MRVYLLTSAWNNEISFITSVTPHEVVGGQAYVGLIFLSVLLLDIGNVQTTYKIIQGEICVNLIMSTPETSTMCI